MSASAANAGAQEFYAGFVWLATHNMSVIRRVYFAISMYLNKNEMTIKIETP